MAAPIANGRNAGQHLTDAFSDIPNAVGKFFGACRSLASPERNAGRSSMGVFDEYATGFAFHPANSPRSVSEEHDVAGIAFDRKIFVERPYDHAFRLRDHGKQGGLRDGAAAGDGGQAASSPRPQFSVDLIAMDVGAITSPASGNAFRQHVEHAFVAVPRQVTIGISSP